MNYRYLVMRWFKDQGSEIMKRIIAAFQFLTIIPIRTHQHLSLNDVASSAVFFPLVGFFQGLLLAAASFLLLKFLSPPVTSALVIMIYLLTNGGFHQDGLSDTFDALSVKSTGNQAEDRSKRLAIMRDGTSGPVGITAIAVLVLLKYILLKEVSGDTGPRDKPRNNTPAHDLGLVHDDDDARCQKRP